MQFTYIIVRHATEKETYKFIKLPNDREPRMLAEAYEKAGIKIVAQGSDPDNCITSFAIAIKMEAYRLFTTEVHTNQLDKIERLADE